MHACTLRDCLGVSRPFVSDTSPKCIDREGLKRRRTGTRQLSTLTIWFSLDHKRNVSDGLISVIGTLFSLDLKLYASDYDSYSKSVASENKP